ncbi:hypothetical protein D3C76_921800 [compost metagenome]
MGDLGINAQFARQGQADAVIAALGFNRADAPLQLVARAGAQHQAAEQVEIAGVLGGFKDLRLQGLQTLVQTQHPLAFGRQFCSTTTATANTALDQRAGRQVVEFVDCIPGCFVTHAGAFCRTGDRTLFGNVLQQGNTLRAADDVLGEQGRQRHKR